MEISNLNIRTSIHSSLPRFTFPRICYVGHETPHWLAIRRGIQNRNIDVCDALNFNQVLEQHSMAPPDLIIVSENGESLLQHEVCSDLRRRGYVGPVLAITGVNDFIDPILALESGADAWAPADVDPHTAVAQIRALLRRSNKLAAMIDTVDSVSNSLRVGDCTLCNLSRECSVNGREVHLPGREFQLLWILAIRAGKIVTRQEMISLLGSAEPAPTIRTIDVCISRIRKRLGASYGKHIKTFRAAGYMLSIKSSTEHSLSA